MPGAEERISQCVERLCGQGCNRVTLFIAGLKAGEELPEVADLNAQERQRVLEELLSVMAVYDSRCER